MMTLPRTGEFTKPLAVGRQPPSPPVIGSLEDLSMDEVIEPSGVMREQVMAVALVGTLGHAERTGAQ